MTSDQQPTNQPTDATAGHGSLDRVDMLRCPDCEEIVPRKDVAEEDYGNGTKMWCCPKCDCESEPDVWEVSSQHIGQAEP